MSSRKVKFKENSDIIPCPECGNKIEFIARSEQVGEDICEVWIECKCGFNPFKGGDGLEDIWGGVDDDNVYWAINEWNDLLTVKSESQ